MIGALWAVSTFVCILATMIWTESIVAGIAVGFGLFSVALVAGAVLEGIQEAIKAQTKTLR